jgi:hypothetical protein
MNGQEELRVVFYYFVIHTETLSDDCNESLRAWAITEGAASADGIIASSYMSGQDAESALASLSEYDIPEESMFFGLEDGSELILLGEDGGDDTITPTSWLRLRRSTQGSFVSLRQPDCKIEGVNAC